MNTLPSSAMTATSPPAGLRKTPQPRPGWRFEKLAGRMIWGNCRMSASNPF